MKNKNTIIIVLLVLLLGIAGYLAFKDKETNDDQVPHTGTTVNTNPNSGDYFPNGNPAILISGKANKEDLISFSIWPGTSVHGVVSYRGSIKGGYFFEGNILVSVLDANKNLLKAGNAMATTDWMTSDPVSFEGNIDFTGLTNGPAYIEIKNDNPSDLRENDKSILVPIVIE